MEPASQRGRSKWVDRRELMTQLAVLALWTAGVAAARWLAAASWPVALLGAGAAVLLVLMTAVLRRGADARILQAEFRELREALRDVDTENQSLRARLAVTEAVAIPGWLRAAIEEMLRRGGEVAAEGGRLTFRDTGGKLLYELRIPISNDVTSVAAAKPLYKALGMTPPGVLSEIFGSSPAARAS